MGKCRYAFVFICIVGRVAQRRHCRLRRMDFLSVPAKSLSPNATALYSPSGLISGFSGHPCPEIAVCERNSKKISFSCAMTVSLFAQPSQDITSLSAENCFAILQKMEGSLVSRRSSWRCVQWRSATRISPILILHGESLCDSPEDRGSYEPLSSPTWPHTRHL